MYATFITRCGCRQTRLLPYDAKFFDLPLDVYPPETAKYMRDASLRNTPLPHQRFQWYGDRDQYGQPLFYEVDE